MIRIEIVANHSVEENILEALRGEEVGKYYTKYPGVYGVGASGPRMGDAIWPEENFALVIWCEEDEARGIARAVAAVKAHFPNEGIKLFGMPEARRIGDIAARITPLLAEPVAGALPPVVSLPVQAPQTVVQAPQTVGEAPAARRIPALEEDGPEDANAE